jgi:2-polyprenyl-6-methoxyphenol hydroxylase-like FAD-dependent oxidoreductase
VDTFNRMTAPDGVAMAVATCRTREPVTAATARLAPWVRLTEVGDCLAWMVDGWPDDEVPEADGVSLHALALRLLAGWPVPVRRIVEEADVPATFLVDLHSARPVEPWPTSNVTLPGDAIHTMSAGRGEGANTALRDAARSATPSSRWSTTAPPSVPRSPATRARCCATDSRRSPNP